MGPEWRTVKAGMVGATISAVLWVLPFPAHVVVLVTPGVSGYLWGRQWSGSIIVSGLYAAALALTFTTYALTVGVLAVWLVHLLTGAGSPRHFLLAMAVAIGLGLFEGVVGLTGAVLGIAGNRSR